MTDQELKEMCDERAEKYGDPRVGFDALGLMWTGILEIYYQQKLPHPIPARISALMMATLKISRASKGFKEDNYDDLKNFLSFAHQFHFKDTQDEAAGKEAMIRVSQLCRECFGENSEPIPG